MSGEIHIGFIPTVGPTCCPTSSRICVNTSPSWSSTSTKIRPALLKRLERGAGLPRAGGAGRDGGVWRHPLYQEPMWLAVPQHHPEASAKAVPLHNLKGKKLLMLADGHCLRDQGAGFLLCRGHR